MSLIGCSIQVGMPPDFERNLVCLCLSECEFNLFQPHFNVPRKHKTHRQTYLLWPEISIVVCLRASSKISTFMYKK